MNCIITVSFVFELYIFLSNFQAATEPVKKAIYEKKIAPRGSKANFISLKEGVLKLQKVRNMSNVSLYKKIFCFY